MSSLAAARADNFYFPPEWTPQMGGISKFQGSKGANQWEQFGIMRFELPFDAWCLGCGAHMSKGLRFNAKKEKEGKYFTTQIFSFSMKCFSCPQQFKILTDPKNRTYDMAEGIRKHEQDFTPDADDSLIVATSDETRQLIAADPMFRLQHGEEDYRRAQTEQERMDSLIEIQHEHHNNLYDANSLLRSRNRKRKKRDIELHKESESKGLGITLLEPSQEDTDLAKEITFTKKLSKNSFIQSEKQKFLSIRDQPIFLSKTPRKTSTTSGTTSQTGNIDSKSCSSRSSKSSGSSIHLQASSLSGQSKLFSRASALQIDVRAFKQVEPPASSASSSFVLVPGSTLLGSSFSKKITASASIASSAATTVRGSALVLSKSKRRPSAEEEEEEEESKATVAATPHPTDHPLVSPSSTLRPTSSAAPVVAATIPVPPQPRSVLAMLGDYGGEEDDDNDF
jgi:coiled-coil domain-containing protein 130